MMDRKKFINTFSDDILCVEEAYKIYLKQHPEMDWIILQSLCRVYILVAVSCVDFFIEHVLEKGNIAQTDNYRKDIESIVKTALKRKNIPNELDISEKITKYISLRELRHYIAHTSLRGNRELKVQLANLHLDVDKFSGTEFNIIKKIVGDIINLIGMSMVLIDNPNISPP